ncbi:MAG: NUDIX hydrolase [Candidatus Sericytochromatia bacterium]|nr:NUDIX hydrolase [Candidatus Sericytochromatia bacterium]
MSNPRIRLGAVLVRDGQVLLVRHRKEGQVYWLLPGGGLEHGESIAEGLAREVREETGFDACLERLVAIVESIAPDGSRHIVHLIAIMVLGKEGIPTDGDPRLDGLAWFEAGQLDNLEMRPALQDFMCQGLTRGWPGHVVHLRPTWIT